MKTLLTLCLSVFTSTLFAQLGGACAIMGPRDSTAWGIGAIKWEHDEYIKGFHDKTKATYVLGANAARLDNVTVLEIKSTDLVLAGHFGNRFLKVFEIKNTRYNVLANTIPGGLWIEFDELNLKNMKFNTYYSLLFNDNPGSVGAWRNTPGELGVNLFKSCLNLRTEPSTNGKLIKCLAKNIDDRKFHRIDIEYHADVWAFITVREYVFDGNQGGEGCPYKFKGDVQGWAKLIDDNGYPNVWFSVTNY